MKSCGSKTLSGGMSMHMNIHELLLTVDALERHVMPVGHHSDGISR